MKDSQDSVAVLENIRDTYAHMAECHEGEPTGDLAAAWAAACSAGIAALKAQQVCTCPSGDGSLSWPCPSHPPLAPASPEAQREGWYCPQCHREVPSVEATYSEHHSECGAALTAPPSAGSAEPVPDVLVAALNEALRWSPKSFTGARAIESFQVLAGDYVQRLIEVGAAGEGNGNG